MLKEMREGAKSKILKLVLFGLLLMAMTGLALMDVQGMFRGGVSNSVIATYGREKLTAQEFDHILQSALRAQQMKQNDAYRTGIPQQVLQQELNTRLFSMAASDIGLQVNDTLAAKEVKEILAPLVAKGMSEKDALQRMLQAYNVSEGQMVGMVKSQTATQQLLKALTAGVYAPQQLIEDTWRYKQEWRRGAYFRLSSEDIGAPPTPSDSELRAYYDQIAAEYALPEYRSLSVIVLDRSALGDEAKLSEEKLKQYYEDNITDFSTAETRTVSQVVAADEAAAKLVYAASKNKDLQKAAGAAGKGKANYIQPGAYTEKELPVELSKTAFSGKAGETLPPVQSPLGWHILRIEKIAPGVTKPFSAVRADIEKELSQDKMSEALYEKANEIDDAIAGGKSISAVAKENNIREIILQKIDARGITSDGQKPDAKLPMFDKIVENGFTLKEGGASPLIETPEGSFIIVGVTAVVPSEQQPFDKVSDKVRMRWIDNSRMKTLSEKSAKIVERLKQGESFEKIAADFKKTVQTTELVQRGSKGKMDENLMSALFSLGGPGMATTVSGDNSLTLVQLIERKVPPAQDMSKAAAETARTLIGRMLKEDLLDQYRMSLMERYNVSINDGLMNERYAPKNGATEDGEEE